jgi:phosphoserine phosphatase
MAARHLTHVLCLIANPAAPGLSEDLVARVRKAVGKDGEPVWLAPGIAAEFPVTLGPGGPGAIERRARDALDGHEIDVAIVPSAGRAKKLLIADMDSTIIQQECLDELADFAGIRARISVITRRAMLGELPFEDALRQRVALLRGVPVSAIEQVLADRIAITPGARILVQTMRAKGAFTVLVSGGFRAFTGPVAKAVGFDEEFANDLVVDGEVIAGRVVEPVRGREGKLQALEELSARLRIPREAALAVGDGANDIAMIEAAGMGVAYHAKPAVAAAADVRIEHGDLTALLYLQGYRAEDFVN